MCHHSTKSVEIAILKIRSKPSANVLDSYFDCTNVGHFSKTVQVLTSLFSFQMDVYCDSHLTTIPSHCNCSFVPDSDLDFSATHSDIFISDESFTITLHRWFIERTGQFHFTST